MAPVRRAALLLVAAVLLGAASPRAAELPASDELAKPVNLWPLFLRRAERGNVDVEVLFSLISYQRTGRKIDLAVRPFYWRSADPDAELSRTDILWPLIKREREKDVVSTRVLPLFFAKASPPESYSLLFPFYHRKREARHRELGILGYIPFTLFMFEVDPDRDLVHQRYLFWTYDRAGEQTTVNMPPIYSQQTSPGQGSVTFFPLFANAWHTPTGFRRLSFIGLADTFNLFEFRRDPPHKERSWHALNLWRMRRDQDWRTVFFPIYWHSEIKGDKTFFFWPLYGRRSEGTSVEYSTVWPFFRWRTDPPNRETDLDFLWPLARDWNKGPKHHVRFLPFFSSTVDPGAAEEPSLLPLALALPVPLSYRAVGPDYSYHRVFYLAWLTENKDWVRNVALNNYYFRNKQTGSVHQGVFPIYHGSRWGENKLDLVLPLYGSYRRPGFTFETLVPLYWRYASTTTATTTVFPVYLDYRSPGYALRVLFPFYYHTRDDARRTELSYYFPVYGTYRRGERVSRHLLFFPLYSRLTDEEQGLTSLDLLWPIFHVERSSATSSTRVLPLFWQSRTPERSFAVAFPLYWDFESAESRHRYLFPLYGSYERPGTLRVSVVGPFYWHVDRPLESYSRSDFLGSLYSRAQAGDELRSHFVPFYWRWSSPDHDSRYVPPLGGYERYGDGTRDLFFLGINRSLNLFSFVRAPRYGERTDRALLYYSHRDRTSALTTLFPLYWSWSDPEQSGRLLFPLFAWTRDRSERGSDLAVLGLTGGFSVLELSSNAELDKSSQRLLFIYHGREKEDRRTVVFPLFWQRLSPPYSRSQLFPLFAWRRDEDEGEKRFGLLGVTARWSWFSWADTKEERASYFWPIYGACRSKTETDSYLAVLGFHRKVSLFLAERDATGIHNRLFPFYSYERRGTPGTPDYYKETQVLWRLYYNEKQGTDKQDVRVLYRFVRRYRGPDESAFELNPFYFKVKKGASTYWAILGGLFGVETRPDGARRYTYFWIL